MPPWSAGQDVVPSGSIRIEFTDNVSVVILAGSIIRTVGPPLLATSTSAAPSATLAAAGFNGLQITWASTRSVYPPCLRTQKAYTS